MKIRKIGVTASVLALGATALVACSPPGDDDDENGSGSDASGRLVVGWNQPFYGFNDDTSNSNNVTNAIVAYLTRDTFNYYDPEQELQQNESFGTYEKTSDDPLTVEYTVDDDSTWSDGTPVDAVDLLLFWGAASGTLNTVGDDVTRDDANYPVLEGGDVFFDGATTGLDLATPEVSDDRRTLTLTYSDPFADWEVAIDGGGVAAHAVGQIGLELDDAEEAKTAVMDAILNEDAEALSPIADTWNRDFDFKDLPDNELLYLSSGPYVIDDAVADESVTFKPNPEYSGDHEAQIETLTISYNEDGNAQAQQLANGEIDLIGPQATADLVEQMEGYDGVEVETGVDASYEHVDLTVNNGGPFDPATYGGDEATALLVRQAFLTAFPRQDIVDRLIVPILPDAEVRNAYTVAPGSPNYDTVTSENGLDAYAEADPQAAAALLAEAGVSAPTVRIMYAADNVRRQQAFEIVKPALEEAGFVIEDAGTPEWSTKLGDGTYDAVTFAWQSTSTAVTESASTYQTGGINNLNGFSDPELDALWSELAITTDEDEQADLVGQIEAGLVERAYGLPIFQFPGVTAWTTDRVEGVAPAPLSPRIFYGFWDWTVPE